MSVSINPRLFAPGRDLRALLIKWVVALLVPLAVFTFVWNGEVMFNDVWLSILNGSIGLQVRSFREYSGLVQVAIFLFLLYGAVIALAGYLVAADSGRRSLWEVWADIFFYAVVPILLIVFTSDLLIGSGFSIVVLSLYYVARNFVRKALHYTPPPPLEDIQIFDAAQQALLVRKGRLGGFWFAMLLAGVWLLADLAFYLIGTLAGVLWIWVAVRTVLLPVLGYFLGGLGGWLAMRQTLARSGATAETGAQTAVNGESVGRARQLRQLSETRKREEARNLVPNDQPLQSRAAWRFYLLLLIVFALLYPALDRALFDAQTAGRLSGYGDLGYYIILALGLNIVVGFAGLLDLGYVAFFVLGTYSWALIGSYKFAALTGILINPQILPWLFWPMLIIGALIAALWGVLLGAPTLRLRGDYLAIVTLGFGEIIPIVFLNLDKVTNGSNGIVGISSPTLLPGIDWTSPTPYYYLIMALIVFCIFANVRLRDSRLGRAWIAIREDEIAAASSGINLVKTKLFAFGAGAFFSGIAGAYHAAKLGTVTPKDFNSTDSIIYLAMVVIGGIGSVPGVIVGAVVVYSLNILIIPQLDSMAANQGNFLHFVTVLFPNFQFLNIRNLIFGLLLVLIMIFRPEGLLPSARRRRELHQAAEKTPEADALSEAAPGTPGFEAEVRVE